MAMLVVIFTANRDSALTRESMAIYSTDEDSTSIHPEHSHLHRSGFSKQDEQAIAAASDTPDCRMVDHDGYWTMGHGAECCRHKFHKTSKQCKAAHASRLDSCGHLRDEESDPHACSERVHNHCNEQKMAKSGFFNEDDSTSPIDYLLAHPSEMKAAQRTEQTKKAKKKKLAQKKKKKKEKKVSSSNEQLTQEEEEPNVARMISADLAEAAEKKEQSEATGSEMLLQLGQGLQLGHRLKHDAKMNAKKELAKKQQLKKLKQAAKKAKATKDRMELMAVSTSPFIRCYAAGIRHCQARLKPSKVKALQGCMQLSSVKTNQCISVARTTRDACIKKSRLD